MARQSARVLVVGGGVAGRTAAAFLRQSGHTVALSAGAEAPAQAGVFVAGNGVRVLSQLGRGDLLDRGQRVEGLEVRDLRGEAVGSEDYREEQKRGAGPVGIARGDLLAALKAAAPGVEERPGEPRPPEATDRGLRVVDGGGEAFYDLVVAADGLGSRLRGAPFRVTSQVAVSFTTKAAGDARAGRILGDRVTLVHHPLGGGLRGVVLVAPAQGAELAALRAAVGPAGAALFDALVPGTLRQGPLVEGMVERRAAGAAVLIGGAACALHPTLGQGAAMAIEDARALQVALDGSTSASGAIEAFEALRRERVAAVHRAGWEQAEASAQKNGVGAAFRGLLHRLIPTLSPDQQLHARLVGGPDLDRLLSHRPDVAPLTPEARDVLRFLVKIGQVDGRFDETERAFARASLLETGHNATEQDLDDLAVETRLRGAAEIVRGFRGHAVDFREHLIGMGVLLAAASGRVTSDEHKALRDACHELEIPRETLERLVKEAVEAHDR